MSYHEEPYYKCDLCGEKLDGLESPMGSWHFSSFGWSSPSYDTHYCQDCTKKREEELEEIKSGRNKE